MGTKSKTTTNQTTTNAPPSWTAPGLSAIGDRVSQAAAAGPGPMYGGDFVAQPGQYDKQVAPLYAAAAQQAQQMVPQFQQQMGRFDERLTPSTFAGYDASALQPVIDAATAPLMRQLQEQILPGIKSSSLESGAYGGTRSMETLPGLAMRDFSRQAQEVAMGLAFQDHQAHQDRLLNAYGLESGRMGMMPEFADTIMRMQSGAGDLMAGAGNWERQMGQLGIDNALMQHQNQIMHPYQGLDVASALLGQVGNPWGTQTMNGTQTQSTGGLGPILGGLMGAGMMAFGMPGGLGGMSSLFAPKSGLNAAAAGLVNRHPGIF